MNKEQQKSALSESESKYSSGNVSAESAKRIRNFRKNKFSEKDLLDNLLKGNKTALGQCITLVESNQKSHQKQAEFIIEGALPHAHKSIRIGITGVPGVGKSTFIESFGSYLINQGKKVAVLAVDPSSSVSHGSILGDKPEWNNWSLKKKHL